MTPNSLTLQTIIDYLLENDSYNFWYTNRNGIIEKLTLRLDYTKDNTELFCRYHTIAINSLNTITMKSNKSVQGAGKMYDTYLKYGHFFLKQSCAIKFLYNRRDKISKKSRIYIEQFPEYLL